MREFLIKQMAPVIFAFVFVSAQLTPQKAIAENHEPVKTHITLVELSKEIKARNPNAQIKVVSPDDLEYYRKPGCGAESDPLPLEVQPVPTSSLEPHPMHVAGHPHPVHYTGNDYWLGNELSGLGNVDGKDLLVVVAVVGAFVVAALFIYSVSYLVQAAASGVDCKAYDEMGLRFSYLQDNNANQSRYGRMHGAYYTMGYLVPFGVLGLTVEAGQHRFDLGIHSAATDKRYEGAYAMIGPSFGFPISKGKDLFILELLAGTSSHKEIGLMSNIRFGLDFALGDRWRLGGNIGAGLIDIKGFDGYLSDIDHLSYLFGVQLGYRF